MEDQVPQGLPGRSFSPLLEGKILGERENIVVFDEYGPVRMIRSREWKLVWRYPGGPHELYNLIEDSSEMNNLFNSPDYADKIRTMRRDLEE